MAHFYGTLVGSRGEATRCGSKASGVAVTAASWEGAVSVYIYYNDEAKKDYARVHLTKWQGAGTEHELYHGPVEGMYIPGYEKI